MKKFLSLVLALVMTMSLVTISAGAKDFTDNSKIAYKEAVDVVSAIGIVDGYEDGAFNPTNTLTRGAAAKIICNLILGPTTASALSADTAPYKDVPTTNTFAGYIAYCAQQGIISGYADGTFRPAATLTGYAFMKMLLGALGYDSTIEGFVGANWSVQVGKQALGIGLDDGNDEFVGTKAVTREEACLYVFNTLQATMVDYDSKITANVNGAEVTIGNSSAKDVAWNTGTTNDGNIAKDGFVQFAEQYFSKLKLKAGTDDFHRPANIWEFKSNEIGTYAKTPDASYTKSVEIGDIYKDLGLAKTVEKSDVSVYVDGVLAKDHTVAYTGYEKDLAKQIPFAIKKGDDDNKYGANGVLTEVFFDEDSGEVTITEINTYAGQVNKNVAATAKKDAYVQIATLDRVPGKTGNLDFETDETFEEDAYVQFTFSEMVDEVKSVAETESVTGTATKTINKTDDMDVNNGMTIDGTDYKVSKMVSGETLGSISVKNDYTIYLDQHGYILYIEEEELTAQDYALVLATANKGTFVGKKADLVFADGTSKVVTTEKDYSVVGSSDYIEDYTIVSFKEDNGVYTLKPVSTKQTGDTYNRTERVGTMTPSYALNADGSTAFKLTNDKASITIGATPDVSGSKTNQHSTVTANSKTVFVVRDTDDNDDYTSYTGIKNAPTIEAANAAGKSVNVYYYCKSGSMTTVMFVFPGNNLIVEDESNKLLYLAKESRSDLQHDANSDYFEYNAVVNGEITTVKVDEDVVVSGAYAIGTSGDGSTLNGLYKTYSVDKYGVITKVTGYDKYTGGSDAKAAINNETGIDKRSADYTVILGTKTGDSNIVVTVDDNAAYFSVDKKGNISTSSYRSVVKDNNDKVFGAMKDYLVQTLIVETVEDGTTTPSGGTGSTADYDYAIAQNNAGNATVRITNFQRPDYVPAGAKATISYDIYSDNAFVASDSVNVDANKTTVVHTTATGLTASDDVEFRQTGITYDKVKVEYTAGTVTGNETATNTVATVSASSGKLDFTLNTTAASGTVKYVVKQGKDANGEDIILASSNSYDVSTKKVSLTGLTITDKAAVVVEITGMEDLTDTYTVAKIAEAKLSALLNGYTGAFKDAELKVEASRETGLIKGDTVVLTATIKSAVGADSKVGMKVTLTNGVEFVFANDGTSTEATAKIKISGNEKLEVASVEEIPAPTLLSVSVEDADGDGKYSKDDVITLHFSEAITSATTATASGTGFTVASFAVDSDDATVATVKISSTTAGTAGKLAISKITSDATGVVNLGTYTFDIAKDANPAIKLTVPAPTFA